MATIFGALGVNDTDRVFRATTGQAIVEVTQTYLEAHNAEMAAAEGIFTDPTPTSNHKLRYKLPMTGKLQRRGVQSQAGAVKANGGWDVAFPLEDFGAQLAANDVDLAYMSAEELQRHIDGIRIQDRNNRRFEILKRLLNSTQMTFNDPLWGNLLVESLANGDAVVYPPVEGVDTEATENHYLESGYAASAISDTNDPYVTLGKELEEHFGLTQGYSNILFLINPAEVAKSAALAATFDAPVMGVNYGQDDSLVATIPVAPGRIVLRHTYGFIAEWSWIPANYVVAIHLDAPRPLYKRVDPADTGLGDGGLMLIAQESDYPNIKWHWRARFGYGASNRLSAAVMELGTGGTYTIPTAYA